MRHRTLARLALLWIIAGVCTAALADTPEFSAPSQAPWDFKQLAKPPKVTWLDTKSPVRSLLYEGLNYQGHPTHVFAFYATPGTLAGDPSKDHRLPAMVLVHGGGGTAFKEWVELWAKHGYAAIAMDTAGARPLPPFAVRRFNSQRLPDGGPPQDNEAKFVAINKPVTEHWPYHAVADVILAHSLIRSFKEVNPDATGITGISWGGYLTCIAGAIDHRFKVAIPVYGCGYINEDSPWVHELHKLSPADHARWIRLYEPSRYLPYFFNTRVLFVDGTNDRNYPLDILRKSYDAVKAPKDMLLTLKMPHSHPAGWAPPEIQRFADEWLGNGAALPHVLATAEHDGKADVEVDFQQPITTATLCYATDDHGVYKHDWQTAPAAIGETHLTAPIPPTTRIWFIRFTDESGAALSSPPVFRK